MGIVSLPSMDDIQQQKDPKQQMEMLINTLGILMKELGEINGYLGGANIRANSITAVKLDVDQLSAITANLGEITAGLIRGISIYGSYIATAEGTYPRAEMSNTEDLFGLLTSISNYIKIMAFDSFAGAPQMEFANGSMRLLMYATPTFVNVQAGGDMGISSSGILDLSGSVVRVPDWSKVVSAASGQTLRDAILFGPS